MTNRPNFVMIVTDQHCADWIGSAGHPVLRTPNIDRIAAKGIRFTEFHTAAPVCMPNRASILTGRYPSVHGLKYNGCALSPRARTFVEMLRDSGYQTAAIGKSHLQPFTGVDVARIKSPDPGVPTLEAWKDDFAGLDLECPAHYEPDDFLQFPKPYYGYDHVDMVTGHGDETGGHYLQWLRKQTPDWAKYRDPEIQLQHNYTCPQARRTSLPEELYSTRYIEDRAREWLGERTAKDNPFFLFVSFPDPHHPFSPPGRYWDMYHPDQFEIATPFPAFENPLPPLQFAHDRLARGEAPPSQQEAIAASDEQCREAMALTAGMIAMIDDAVGRILDTLEAQGLDESTVVIFTSDHGDYLGDGNLLLKGPWMRPSLYHVPFIWSDGMLEAGTETDLLGSSLDICAMVLARARVQPYFGIQGRDLLADYKAGAGRDALLIEFNDNMPRLGLRRAARTRTILTRTHRLTIYPGEDWGELYDAVNDPRQIRNLWADPGAAATKSDLLERLAAEMAGVMDESPRALKRA